MARSNGRHWRTRVRGAANPKQRQQFRADHSDPRDRLLVALEPLAVARSRAHVALRYVNATRSRSNAWRRLQLCDRCRVKPDIIFSSVSKRASGSPMPAISICSVSKPRRAVRSV